MSIEQCGATFMKGSNIEPFGKLTNSKTTSYLVLPHPHPLSVGGNLCHTIYLIGRKAQTLPIMTPR